MTAVATVHEIRPVVDELEAVRAALAALVPAAPADDVVALVRHVGHKLEGHGVHCTRALNPPVGSHTIDEVRNRCSALLGALQPHERRAVLALLVEVDRG